MAEKKKREPIRLTVPIEAGVRVKDRAGKTRSYGVKRKQICLRIKTHHLDVMNGAAKQRNEYFQSVVDDVIDAGIKAMGLRD